MLGSLVSRAEAWTGLNLLGNSSLDPNSLQGRLRHLATIVLIVAIAVVLVAGIVAYSLVLYQCIKHGYNHVEAYGPNGWRVWEFRIVCSR